jgi:hypothetical protein
MFWSKIVALFLYKTETWLSWTTKNRKCKRKLSLKAVSPTQNSAYDQYYSYKIHFTANRVFSKDLE